MNVKELWEDAWSKHGIGKFPEKEFRFHPVRRFRFDYAWPDAMVAVETDGFHGRHQTVKGFSNDNEKMNLAIEGGWVVVRFTARQLGSKQKRHDCAKQVLNILKRRRIECTILKDTKTAQNASFIKPDTK